MADKESSNLVSRVLDDVYRDHFTVDGRLYWLYLLITLVIALVFFFFTRPKSVPLSLRSMLRYVFPARIYSNRSTFIDAGYFVVNSILWVLIATPFLLFGFFLADTITTGLTKWFGAYPDPYMNSSAFIAGFVLAFILAMDLAFYLAHRLMHKIGFLWEFHKVHHSAEVLNPLTLFREHPVDKIINSVFFGLAIAVVLGVFEYFNGRQFDLQRLAWVEGVVFFLAGGHFRHMEIWISYGRYINHIIISPAHHWVHHSNDPRHLDKNFGGFLAIWDWWFNSLYLPDKRQKLVLGLSHNEHSRFSNVWKLYYLPFVNLYSRITRRK